MQTPLAPRIMPYHSQRQCKMLTLRYITMENFKINTTCTYALKQDHAGFTGFYTLNCAIVLLVLYMKTLDFVHISYSQWMHVQEHFTIH